MGTGKPLRINFGVDAWRTDCLSSVGGGGLVVKSGSISLAISHSLDNRLHVCCSEMLARVGTGCCKPIIIEEFCTTCLPSSEPSQRLKPLSLLGFVFLLHRLYHGSLSQQYQPGLPVPPLSDPSPNNKPSAEKFTIPRPPDYLSPPFSSLPIWCPSNGQALTRASSEKEKTTERKEHPFIHPTPGDDIPCPASGRDPPSRPLRGYPACPSCTPVGYVSVRWFQGKRASAI